MKLKEEFKGTVVTLSTKIGKVIFNTNIVKEEDYQLYYDLGFEDYFIKEEVIIKEYKNIENENRGRRK